MAQIQIGSREIVNKNEIKFLLTKQLEIEAKTTKPSPSQSQNITQLHQVSDERVCGHEITKVYGYKKLHMCNIFIYKLK